ncbi:MAG: glycoside hydrolase family 3 C-terminal domain-containing protein [Chitinispirillaceae bacterium]|nr:glycoside hydrolase family 3 C-terminal domain-containing protein [Chitinispirillaceae bacterium]
MKRIAGILALAIVSLHPQVFGQSITGRVVTSSDAAVPDANVVLKVRNVSTVTNATGQFSLDLSSATRPLSLTNGIASKMHFNGASLVFTVLTREKVAVELFTMSGGKVAKLMDRTLGSGTHAFPITAWLRQNRPQGVSVVRIAKGGERYTLAFITTGASVSLLSGSGLPLFVARTPRPAAVGGEILKVSKSGYVPRTLDITSYTAQNLGDIVLATVNQDSITIERKVDSLLALMTNAEKAGQMVQAMNSSITPADVTQYGFGSVFNGGEEPVTPNTAANWAARLNALQDGALASRLKIPLIYGLDAVHGNGKVVGSTIFPHNIALGCTGDTALVEQVGRVTAYECRALGIHLTFAPCVSVVRDERWGRSYEGFGETPGINAAMGASMTRGLQGDGDQSKPSTIAACVKHYLGDGGTTGGVNGGITTLTEATMRAIHYPPYAACAREKMASVMPSYNAWSRNGQTIKQTIDSVSLTGMLKRELNWDGFILTDYDAIPQAMAGGYSPLNVGRAVMAGCDMAMIPNDKANCITFISSVQSAVTSGYLTQARLDDATRRILRVKFRMNLWANPKSQSAMISRIGHTDHRAVARESVRKSLVLLKNENTVLPLQRTERIAVVGPWASAMGAQCGGWTLGWQGIYSYTPTSVGGGQTIIQALQNPQFGGSNIINDPQGNNLTSADKIVLVVGETPYAEGYGDHGFVDPYPSNPDPNLALYPNRTRSILLANCPYASLIDKCYNSGKPVVIVLISGRPMIITGELEKCKAFVCAWQPGTEGLGVADVLYGDYNFTGKLTHSWPNALAQIPVNTGTAYADELKGSGGTPLFSYGFGLSY